MAQSDATGSLSRPSILLAEDDEALSQLIRESLEAIGYRIQICSNAKDAIRMIESESFNFLILDWHLSNGTGDQIVFAARRSGKSLNVSTPILMMSGNFDPKQLVRLRAQLSAAIVKPIDLKTFTERVKLLCPLPKSNALPEGAA